MPKIVETPMGDVRHVIEGRIEACCHVIDWWFDIGPETNAEIEDDSAADFELNERLAEAAEDRARELIAEDYWTGELCFYDADREREYRGWWKIVTD